MLLPKKHNTVKATYLLHSAAEGAIELLLKGLDANAALNLGDDVAELTKDSTTLLDCFGRGLARISFSGDRLPICPDVPGAAMAVPAMAATKTEAMEKRMLMVVWLL